MSKHVIVPASGTSATADRRGARARTVLFRFGRTRSDEESLNAVSMDNWLKCVDEALRKSGTKPDGTPYTRADIDFANILLIKPSAHREMLERLGLREDQSVYLGEYGHTGEQDAMFSIVEGLKQGRLKDGDLMVIVAAGIGYVWAAGVVRWGKISG
jgi:3-oxoacyl-[acyl-carrier-protein] synthase-3